MNHLLELEILIKDPDFASEELRESVEIFEQYEDCKIELKNGVVVCVYPHHEIPFESFFAKKGMNLVEDCFPDLDSEKEEFLLAILKLGFAKKYKNIEKIVLSMLECDSGNELVKYLLDSGKFTEGDIDEFMCSACFHGYYERVRFLLSRGVSANCCDDTLDTPLINVCKRRMSKRETKRLVSLLLEYGADIHAVDEDENDVIWWAHDLENTDILECLEELT